MSLLSGWCASHGTPDQWHDACTYEACACPNHADEEK